MATDTRMAYPYIPNSAPQVKADMLKAIGADSMEDLYRGIPQELRLNRPLDLPKPFPAEADLKRHVDRLLAKNRSCNDLVSFLGAGTYQHHVPSICDEINGRSEFLTAYAGEPYDDHGRFQAMFEYCSMMGELLNMEIVAVPCYDGWQAAATGIRMAQRLTGRSRAVIVGPVDPDKLSFIRNYCRSDVDVSVVERGDVAAAMTDDVACLYFEVPNYLGVIDDGAALVERGKASGARVVVSVDPTSLGVVTPPADYGADIVVGDIQGLGIHMSYGGGQAGFIASHDDPEIVMQYPSRLFGIAETRVPGEYGFGDVAYDRTSFGVREEGNEWVGTAAALWGITAGVYLAAMGPQGMQDLGVTLMQRARYAAERLDALDGVSVPTLDSAFLKEFPVAFDKARVADVAAALLERDILIGKDISGQVPGMDNAVLVAVTEIHGEDEIDGLVSAIREVL